MGLPQRLVVIWILLMCSAGGDTAHHDFCYDKLKCGPKSWGGLCKDGLKQSPIQLQYVYSDFLKGEKRELFESNGYFRKQGFVLKNNGHTVYAKLTAEQELNTTFLYGSLLGEVYHFLQIHFHWGSGYNNGSEHVLGGERSEQYPLEAHLVHYSSNFKDIKEAIHSKETGALAVIGIFFELSEEDNLALDPIVRLLPDVAAYHGEAQGSGLVLSDFIYQSLFSEIQFIQYEGSLTTPGCEEVVLWNVMVPPMPISLKQLNAFRQVRTADNKPLVDNFRPLQGKNARILKYFRTSATPGQTLAAIRMPDVESKAGDSGGHSDYQALIICISSVGAVLGVLLLCILMSLCYFKRKSDKVKKRYRKANSGVHSDKELEEM